MKEKIIIFFVGLFLGAIISTGSIYIYTIANKNTLNTENMQMPNNNFGEGGNGQMGNPPEMPNQNNQTN